MVDIIIKKKIRTSAAIASSRARLGLSLANRHHITENNRLTEIVMLNVIQTAFIN